MVIASVGTIGSGQSKAAGTSFTFGNPFTNALEAGNIGVLVVAADNINTGDGNANEHTSVTDSVSNVWTKQREFRNGQAGAAAGATVSVWKTKATTTLPTTGTITVNFSASIAAKCASVWEFTVAAGNDIQVVPSGTPNVDAAYDGVDVNSVSTSGLPSAEHLHVRGIASERANATITATAGFTLMTNNGTTGGGAATNMNVTPEFRIATNTGDTSNPTSTAVDHATTFTAFEEFTPVTFDPATIVHNFSYMNLAGDMIPRKVQVFQPSHINAKTQEYITQLHTLLNRYQSWSEVLAVPFDPITLIGAWESNRLITLNVFTEKSKFATINEYIMQKHTLNDRYKSYQTFLPAPDPPLQNVGEAMAGMMGYMQMNITPIPRNPEKLIIIEKEKDKLKEFITQFHTLADRYKSWKEIVPFDDFLAMVSINAHELIRKIQYLFTTQTEREKLKEKEIQILTLADRFKSWKAVISRFTDYSDIIEIDPSQFTGFTEMRLVAIFKTDVSGQTARVKLTNVTDSTTELTLTTTKDFFTTIRSSTIPLPATAKRYKVEIGADLGDTTTAKYAGLEVR